MSFSNLLTMSAFTGLAMLSSLLAAESSAPSQTAADFDIIIKGGTVYDGTGAEPKHVDVAIRGDRIAGVGDFKTAKAKTVIDATGLAVAPGFINMLSWSNESLIQDGRSYAADAGIDDFTTNANSGLASFFHVLKHLP